MKRKYMPLILMLTAGAITSIITFIRQYSVVWRLTLLLVVLVVFYAIGSGFKWILDTFDRQNEKAAMADGEVIEKESESGLEDAGAEQQTKEEQQTREGQE